MNILVLGNGFDLAHDLPTSYRAFLDFTKAYEKYKDVCMAGESVKEEWEKADEANREFIVYFANLCDRKKKLFVELNELTINNLWLKHFYDVRIKQGWIDFESEISRIIQILESVRIQVIEEKKAGKLVIHVPKYQEEALKGFRVDNTIIESLKFVDGTKERLHDDLNRLIRCLEIYLCDYVGNIEIENKHPDIEGLPIIDKVLSFNYTNTYEKLYAKNPYVEYDYIHGRATIENTVDSNNMVLGIDEYLKGAARNENIEFIEFKKFFQRIHKETGCLYRNWVNAIESGGAITETIAIYKEQGKTVRETKQVNFHKVFFFGHSLDVTDKDIIRELILQDKVKTTIFYRNKSDYGQKITNLVKIIGQDELIKRTGGANKSIYFKEITKG